MNRILLLLLLSVGFVLPAYPATLPASPSGTTIIQPKPELRKGSSKMRLLKKWAIKKLRMAAGEPTERQKKMGKLSLIFGGSSLLLLFIPYVNILAIPAAIAGLVLGIKSVKGNTNTPGLIGLILGGVTIFLFIIALAYLATFGFFI